MEKDKQCNTKHNAIGEATVILDKLNFTTRNITRCQEGHFIKRKNQAYIKIINGYVDLIRKFQMQKANIQEKT